MITLEGKYNKDCKIFIDKLESGAIEMIQELLDHELSEGVPVRIMPDTHIGKGIVIGFTMPMTNMVNPNHIGVDIGCSVTTHRLSRRFRQNELPEIDQAIRKAVPMGHKLLGKKAFSDWWVEAFLTTTTERINSFIERWNIKYHDNKQLVTIDKAHIAALCKQVDVPEEMFYQSVGTLGGGNHFIEIGKSVEEGDHYLTLHSGSRHFGYKVCHYHAQQMAPTKKLPKAYFEELEDIKQNTAPKSAIQERIALLNQTYRAEKKEYLLTGDAMFHYLFDMVIAQTYAEFNHKVMAQAIFDALGDVESEDTIHSMHNFIDTQDWVIRKGAIRSYEGERMLIPFNMRDGILICKGKSNADWNYSAPHGAGRILGRNQAMRRLSMDEFRKEMKHVYSTSITKATLDEAPMAYKDKQLIIDAIHDTAHIIDTLQPILNIKAS